MEYENTQHLDQAHELVKCRERLASAESRIAHLEQVLEQLTRDYTDLALAAAAPKNGGF